MKYNNYAGTAAQARPCAHSWVTIKIYASGIEKQKCRWCRVKRMAQDGATIEQVSMLDMMAQEELPK